MNTFLQKYIYARTDEAMVVRTALEAIFSWFVANLPEILNLFSMPDALKALISSFVMVVISWALGVIRKKNDLDVTN